MSLKPFLNDSTDCHKMSRRVETAVLIIASKLALNNPLLLTSGESDQKGCPEIDDHWKSESGCHRDKRESEEVDRLLRQVLIHVFYTESDDRPRTGNC